MEEQEKVRAHSEGGTKLSNFFIFFKKVRKANPATPPRGTDICPLGKTAHLCIFAYSGTRHDLSLWELAILGSCR